MRKATIVMVSLISLFVLSSCEKSSVVTANELPIAAQNYVKENYGDSKITFVKRERGLYSTKYEVRLDNGLEIEFDGEGVPVDIDAD